ncbi:hypothetical protein GCM10023210_35060 [Chryseobacterium ginsengisoli]|uniref:DUF2931 domain-containing protein n=2 Tax=Chryseobacterium ginsengisoli TaxID=363853 RepID=A0ABP9MPW0_9FLAO
MNFKTQIVAWLLGIFQLISCQQSKKQSMSEKETVPVYNVEISHPDNKYLITPVEDKIFTFEGNDSSLPYGSSSGNWGDSGKTFTERRGTPKGADIVYFSRYEDTFYHLKTDFPEKEVKDFIRRAYADEEDNDCGILKEFVYTDQENYCGAYKKLGDLVFGFAPKGMVVVWLRFGYVQIELGKFQAEVVKDDKKYAEKLFSKISQTREDIKKDLFIANASPLVWEKYRTRYQWAPTIHSENKGFKLFNIQAEYYNGEREVMLRPWVEKPVMKERALPKEITFFWETGKGEAFEGRAFFNWAETDDQFENAGENFPLELKIAPDNKSFEVLLLGHPIKIDSTRVYTSNFTFKDSYK